MNKKQSGFAVLESLLILIIITVIGGVGWYAVHTKHQTDKILAQSEKTSQSTPVNSKNSAQKYLNIKEWSVRVPYSGSDTYTYRYDSAHPDSLEIQSGELADKYNCSEEGAGIMGRFLPTDQIGLGVDGDPTAQQYAKDNPGTYFKVGDYYYSWTHDQAPCSETVTPAAQNEVSSAFQSAVKNIEAIPQ